MQTATAPHTPPGPAPTDLPGSPDGTGHPPRGWIPFAAPELELWVGPNLAVACRNRKGGWQLATPPVARDLLLRHALARSAQIDRALDAAVAAITLGTPFDRAVWAYRHALPGFACVIDRSGTTATFLRSPEAVLQVGAGRLGELEWARWRTGADAIDLLLQHRVAWEPDTGSDVTIVRPSAPEGQVLRRALAVGGVGLVAGPFLTAPLLLADAVLWIIAIASVWTAGVFLGPSLLRAWDHRYPQPALRLDPWRLWLPAPLGPTIVDRSAIRASMAWRKAFGTANTGISRRGASVRNPAMIFLNLRGPDLDLRLGSEGEPPEPSTIPLMPEKDAGPNACATLPRAAFWTLANRLAAPASPARPKGRAGTP